MIVLLSFIPVALISIWLEYRQLKKIGRTQSQNFKESFSNTQYGILDALAKMFLKAYFIIPYVWVYDQYHYFEMDNSNIMLWVLSFIAMDFVYYWYHRSVHEIKPLWAFHVNHHEIRHMNLTAGFRMSISSAAVKPLFYIPLALIGFPVEMIVLSELILQIYQFPLHTEVISKWPLGLSKIFCTPENHRVHHGSNPEYIDKNYAGTLIIWDKMFGTYQEQISEIKYGASNGEIIHNAFLGNILCFRELWRWKKYE
jgi:alkylglycerol monooxygenase